MFLLIQVNEINDAYTPKIFTFQYVSINTTCHSGFSLSFFLFTFQYVSINTQNLSEQEMQLVNLHSNMFLLIHAAGAFESPS